MLRRSPRCSECGWKGAVREAHALHGVEVIEVAPVFLEAVRCRQGLGVIAKVVLAELAGIVAQVDQELGKCRRSLTQIGRATRELRGGSSPCVTDTCR